MVSVGKGTIVVALLADLGPTIEGGRLMVNRTFLWTSLRDRLRQLRDASGEFNTHLVAVLTGQTRPAVGERDPSPFAAAGPPLNAEQMLALRRLLGSDVLWGWGPPGTGKTVVCERMIADGLYPARRSTLLAGPTNKSVDLALGRVLERLRCNGQLDAALAAGHILRVGPVSDHALQRAYGAAISLEAIVAAKSVALSAERERLIDEEAASGRDGGLSPARGNRHVVALPRRRVGPARRVPRGGSRGGAGARGALGLVPPPACSTARTRQSPHWRTRSPTGTRRW